MKINYEKEIIRFDYLNYTNVTLESILDGKSIEEAFQVLTETLMDEIRSKGFFDVRFSNQANECYHCGGDYLTLLVSRYETDDEQKKRIQRDEKMLKRLEIEDNKAKTAKEKRERKEWERLKKKYGS